MKLDPRQRAMLREMGVRVWQPTAPEPVAWAAPPVRQALKGTDPAVALASAPVQIPTVIAINSGAATAGFTSARGTFRPQPAAPQPPAPAQAGVRSDSGTGTVSWSAGQALALYAQTALTSTPGSMPRPRWLVLAETPAAALQVETTGADNAFNTSNAFNPFDGEAGKLLDNMLRAVQLHKTGSVLLAPLVRRIGHDAAPQTSLDASLASLVQAVQPDVVLVMGRLAAQALLQSSEPFGKLRGRLHSLHGRPTVVTHDAAYLLRSPLEKARVWEDLCLAVSVL